MTKNKGIVYTMGLLLALLIGLVIIFAVGFHLVTQKTGQHTISARDLFLVKESDGYEIKMLITNDGSDQIKINKIDVTDGQNDLIFGDTSGNTAYFDSLANKNVVIGPGQTYILQEFKQTNPSFTLNSGVTATIYYTDLATGNTYTITIGGKAVLSSQINYPYNTISPPPPPQSQPTSGSFKVIFTPRVSGSPSTTIINATSGWEAATSPPGNVVWLGQAYWNGYNSYMVSASGTSNIGYKYYAYYPQSLNPNNAVTVTGLIAASYSIYYPVYQYSPIYLYAVSASNPSQILSSYQIATISSSFSSFNVTITGINQPYYIAIGRPLNNYADPYASPVFTNVQITIGGTPSSISTLAFKVNGTIAPNLFQYDTLNGHLTITDSNGNHLPYTVLYYDNISQVAWIGVKPVSSVPLDPSKPYVITVNYNLTGDNPASNIWYWARTNYNLMDNIARIIQSSIKSEYIDSSGTKLYVQTNPQSSMQTYNTLLYYLNYPTLKGCEFSIYESGKSTTYNVYFNTVDGTRYMLTLSSCLPSDTEFKLYVSNGTSWNLIAQAELGCHNYGATTAVDIVSDNTVPSYSSSAYKYIIGKPIDLIWVEAYTGDSGNSYAQLFVYPGQIGTSVDSMYPMLYHYVWVSYG